MMTLVTHPGTSFEDPSTDPGRAWRSMIDILSNQSEFFALYWSRWLEQLDTITVLTGRPSFSAILDVMDTGVLTTFPCPDWASHEAITALVHAGTCSRLTDHVLPFTNGPPILSCLDLLSPLSNLAGHRFQLITYTFSDHLTKNEKFCFENSPYTTTHWTGSQRARLSAGGSTISQSQYVTPMEDGWLSFPFCKTIPALSCKRKPKAPKWLLGRTLLFA